MNFYNLHSSPSSLDGHENASDLVPELVWKTYCNYPNELKKRKSALAKSATFAYLYAAEILDGRFPEGEAAIAKHGYTALRYAQHIIKGRWPKGEAAIASEAWQSFWYARDVLHGRFPGGEATIAKHPDVSKMYQQFLKSMKPRSL